MSNGLGDRYRCVGWHSLRTLPIPGSSDAFDLTPGTYWLAFQVGWADDPEDQGTYAWEDPPHYGNEIEIVSLSFEQSTWGAIKAGLMD